MKKSIRLIITGSTGMVGEGVLFQSLNDERVDEVLVINRRPCGVQHPKLKEILHSDFFDLSSVAAQLKGYDACFFCLGVSSVGMKEDDYHKMTYLLTMHVAETLCRLNPDMSFCYISGAGTDSSEQGRSMWARVKGKTENALMKLPFKAVYAFRPGFIRPIPGMRHTHGFYRYINWLFPIGRKIFPSAFCTLEELSAAMMHTALYKQGCGIVGGKDIIGLSAAYKKDVQA